MAGHPLRRRHAGAVRSRQSNLYFFLGKNFLATVHALPSKSGAIVRERLVRNPELLARGSRW